MITSRQNPRIKALAGLQQSRIRRETGLSLVEGLRPAREALLHAEARTLVLSEGMDRTPGGKTLAELAKKREIEVLRLTDDCYRKISGLRHPEGAAAVVALRTIDPESLFGKDARLAVAAGLQDPGNAGAIVRAAEAAGASGFILLEGVDVSHPRFLRGAMGSAFRLPCAALSIAGFLAAAREHRIRILAAGVAGDARVYTEADFTPPVALCIGGEGAGLPGEIEEAADERITIPMSGHVESLNAAVAAGIILFQARRQWQTEP